MRTKERIYPVFRRVIYIALFVLTGVVQNTLLGMRGSILLPLIPLTVAVCVFEHEYAGFFFGLLGGALYDLASPAADGIYAIVFAVLGCAAGLVMHYLCRGTLLSAFLLTLIFALCTALTGFIFMVLAKDRSGAFAVFRSTFLPGAVCSSLLLPVFYYPIRLLDQKLR